jgi:hypothetical protein
LSAATEAQATEKPTTDSAAKVVFAMLVLACFAAFFVTQRLKHTPTAVQQFRLTPRFSPTPSGHIKQERISFKLAKANQVTVTIIDAKGNLVATLVREQQVPRYKVFSLRWNGRLGTARRYALLAGANGRTIVVPATEGRTAPAGEYRVQVRLRGRALPVLSPRSFTLVK